MPVQRNKASFSLKAEQQENIKKRMLNWSKQFSILLLLDSNNYTDRYSRYEFLLGAGVYGFVPVAEPGELYKFHNEHKDWLFGHINYDYKNQLEPKLSSRHKAQTGFPDFFFFQPEVVCYICTGQQELVIETISTSPEHVFEEIMSSPVEIAHHIPKTNFARRTEKQTYIDTVNALRNHIKEGDCYEINYCNEGFAENVHIEPVPVFNALNQLSRAPFAAYYRNEQNYMMCASPERYIRKQGDDIISQPIKGTARRGQDETTDARIKEDLYLSIKDRAENVMITDLVRNDLARSCETGSVEVEELFGIYTFPQVHQMISTVRGRLDKQRPFTDVLKYSFPMGSMTGAPKIKVMELIDRYEDTRRELFSGTVGYITPGADFDFNVIIRSLFYNAEKERLSYQSGGAITYDSIAESEWEEMRLKAWALERLFAGE
ncbi:MAG TPA: anthranilate synthase component I family protein [Flavipsychrobacter sp.]